MSAAKLSMSHKPPTDMGGMQCGLMRGHLVKVGCPEQMLSVPKFMIRPVSLDSKHASIGSKRARHDSDHQDPFAFGCPRA